jgi:hypothetical protein
MRDLAPPAADRGRLGVQRVELAHDVLADVTKSKITLIDVSQAQVLAPIVFPQRHNPFSLNFSPDSARLVVSDWDWGIEILCSPTGEVLLPWIHPSAYNVGGASYANSSPDGLSFVACWWEGARLLNTVSGERIGPMLGHDSQCEFALFEREGRRLFTLANDCTVRIWDTANRIVTGTSTAIYWWEARSGLPAMEPFRASHEPIARFDVDRKGKTMILIGTSGRMEVWTVPPQYEKQSAPTWLPRLASALAGVRLDENGALVPVAGGFARAQAELAAVRRELAALPADAPYAEWGRWILADPDKRTIAPGLNITVAEARTRGLTD